MLQQILKLYRRMGQLVKADASADTVTDQLLELYAKCNTLLARATDVPLKSNVPDKTYFAFGSDERISRAVNKGLFERDAEKVTAIIKALREGDLEALTPEAINSALYSVAICFCCSIDLLKDDDQKTPGTFFEYFVVHWFTRLIGVQPTRKIPVLNLDMETSLPTDYIFDLGPNNPKIHLPVKTSTRERVIQVWAHQRVLDGVYGTGRFLGMLVCLSETKVDKNKLDVDEICLPDQWRLYQMFISNLKRIYYLDVPTKYQALNDSWPPIAVRSLGAFFYEVSALTKGKIE